MARCSTLCLGGVLALAVGCGETDGSTSGNDGVGGTSDSSAGAAPTGSGSGGIVCRESDEPDAPFEAAGAASLPACDGISSELPFLAGERLRLRVLVDEQGVQIPLPRGSALFDAQLGLQCTLGQDDGGNTYCSTDQRGLVDSYCQRVEGTPAGVRFSEEPPDSMLDLAPHVLVGDDGSRLATGAFFDRGRQVNLQLSAAEGYIGAGNYYGVVGSGRLVPRRVSWSLLGNGVSHYQSASGCDGQSLFALRSCQVTSETKYVTMEGSQHVEGLGESYSLPVDRTFRTAYRTGVTAYSFYGPGQSLQTTVTDVLVPTELPLETWPQAEVIRLGTGRFRYDAWRIGCFTTRTNGWLHDTERDERCAPHGSDDNLSCVPIDDVGEIVYSDAACTRQVVVISHGRTPKYAFNYREMLPDPTFFAVGGRLLDTSAVYQKDTQCSSLANSYPNPTKYELLDAIPPESFGALHVEVAP